MIGAASRRRAALVVFAWCAALAALAVDAPLEAHAEDPAIEHDHTPAVMGLQCDRATLHSSGAACYTHDHSQNQRRLDHYQGQEDRGPGWTDTDRTWTSSCTRKLQDEDALDHGMGDAALCEPPDPPPDSKLRWQYVRTEYADSGHTVTWHEATNTQDNNAPAFQPPTYHPTRAADGRYEVDCCSTWVRAATLRALDSDVPPNWSDDQQDSLQFRSRSSAPRIAPSQIRDSRHLAAPGGAMDADVWLLPAQPGEINITIDVRDRRDGSDSITIGPFRVLPDPNQPPTVSISGTGAPVVEGRPAGLWLTVAGSFAPGSSGTVQYRAVDGTATAPNDFNDPGPAELTFTGPGTNRITVNTVDDSDVEGSESFTVVLSNASGVDIGTSTATVTIADNDGATPPCPAGQTGTPPNCVPDICPTGQIGTPPNCVPIVVSTGCSVPAARLSALTVAAGGSSVLSGFSSTTYAYAVTVDSASARFTATAADAAATVGIGRGSASAGSASSTQYVAEGGSVDIEVVVTNGGDSCTYTVTLNRPGGAVTDCPAMSGTQLVNGVCVEACPGDTLIPQFDSNGEVMSCLSIGVCPFDLYGTTAAEVARRGQFWFWPRWLDGPQSFSPVAAGESGTLTRRVAKCDNIWNFDPFGASPGGVPDSCIWRERNIGLSDGDCLKFSLSVEAVVPEVEDTTNRWSYKVSGCGHNESADRQASTSDPWEEDDRNCNSTDGQWIDTTGVCFVCSPQAQPTGIDTGDWTVTLGDLTQPSGSIYGTPYVDVPLEVDVTDWGDVSHLQIRVQAVAHRLQNSHNDVLFADFALDRTLSCSRCNFSSMTVVVPRRSGPPPSDDVIEVNIGAVDDLPISRFYWHGSSWRRDNEQRVEILRSQLLANDACPVGTDCTDPYQWPMQIVGDAARSCVLAGVGSGSMTETPQGVVGCDELDEVLDPPDPNDPPSALYWPHLWAVGEDKFSYRTYGGDATVTIRFTDQPPSGVTPVTSVDAGHTFQEALFPRTDSDHVCIRGYWAFGIYHCQDRAWRYTYTRDDSSIADVLYHSGVVSLPVPVDADGDYAGTRLAPSAVNADVEGRYSIRADMLSGRPAGTDFYTEIYDAATGDGSTLGRSCVAAATYYPYCSRYTSRTLGGMYCITTDFYGGCRLWESLDDARARRLGYAQTDTRACEARTAFISTSLSRFGFDRYVPVAGQTECVPRDVFACETDLAAHAVCWSAKRLVDQPAEMTIPYIACDDRYLHFLGDHADAETAGRTVDDYCTPGTVTVHLGGGQRIETSLTVSQATAIEGAPLIFEVQLSEAALADVVMDYTATSVTATAGVDYLIPPGRVTIPAGDTTAAIRIATVQDDVRELDETLRLVLSSARGATLGTPRAATGTIIDDDDPPLPKYAGPPPAPECPTNWHEHGFDCQPDHLVPIVCGTSTHGYQVHDTRSPTGHRQRTHPACVSALDACSTGFHDHTGGCVPDHRGDPQLPCRPDRRLVWLNTVHDTPEVLACPAPTANAEMLISTAGVSITLRFGVDVTSGHVEPARTFTITAVNGTAVNGAHYSMTPITATLNSANQTYETAISTMARQDHGTQPRTFTITITDAHPLRGHVSVTMTATINPPAIGRT